MQVVFPQIGYLYRVMTGPIGYVKPCKGIDRRPNCKLVWRGQGKGLGQHNAGPINCLHRIAAHQGHNGTQVDDPRECTVGRGALRHRVCIPGPLDAASQPRLCETRPGWHPCPHRPPARAQILPKAGSTAKAVLLVSPTRDFSSPHSHPDIRPVA